MASPSSPSSPGGDVQAKAGFTTNVTDPLSHVIGMETTSDALAEDSLATLDALMRDPLRESLESIVASSEPRNRSDSDPMDIDMMREGPVIEERLKKLVMMGQIDKTVAKKWLQTKLRQKVTGAREKRRGKRRRRVALRRIRRSKRKLARLIRKLRKRLRRKSPRIRKRIQLRIRELREAQNTSKRIQKEVQKSTDPMNRVVLSKEERQAKKSWQRKLGTRVDVQTWRASKSFKKMAQQDGSRLPSQRRFQKLAGRTRKFSEQRERRRPKRHRGKNAWWKDEPCGAKYHIVQGSSSKYGHTSRRSTTHNKDNYHRSWFGWFR